MRDTGWTIGRLAAPGGSLALAVVVALGTAGCGGDAGSTATRQAEAMDAPAAGEAPGAMEAPAAGGAMAEAKPTAQELPAGVTAAMVDEGKKIFTGAGICFSCHGPEGKGVPNLGANLADSEWVHSDGSFEGIVKTVTAGVAAEKSSSGVPMPPKGGATINDAQVKAVAAYVWTLSHGGKS